MADRGLNYNVQHSFIKTFFSCSSLCSLLSLSRCCSLQRNINIQIEKESDKASKVSSILRARGLQTSYIPLSLLFFLFFSKRFDFFCWLWKVGMPWSCSMQLKNKRTLISVALLLHMHMHHYTLLRWHICKVIWLTLESLFSSAGKNASSLVRPVIHIQLRKYGG